MHCVPKAATGFVLTGRVAPFASGGERAGGSAVETEQPLIFAPSSQRRQAVLDALNDSVHFQRRAHSHQSSHGSFGLNCIALLSIAQIVYQIKGGLSPP